MKQEMDEERNRAKAQQCLKIVEKLLMARDLIQNKKFAGRDQAVDPLLDSTDQILTIVDILLASKKQIKIHLDWYLFCNLMVSPAIWSSSEETIEDLPCSYG
uniref:Uncharacterized protein n=1 Tax=Nelumbo nucifera TaxID=4432 RepID=A0A822Z1M8_NELNU|nr:TPA_asm: hypothetical protein HUJ06_007547 [Nelumbo nucifera]